MIITYDNNNSNDDSNSNIINIKKSLCTWLWFLIIPSSLKKLVKLCPFI